MPLSHSFIPLLFLALSLSLSLSTISARSLHSNKHHNNNHNGNVPRQASAPSAGDWYARNLNTIRSIYDLTVYPNNLPIITQGGHAVPPGLFDRNATGRVSPVGDFEGFEDSIEYFFALAPVPQATNTSTAIYDAQVVDFVSGCPDVAASLVYLRTGSVDQVGRLDRRRPTSTLSQVAFWRFNPQGAVLDYQAWVPNLQAWTRENTGINYDSMQVQAAAAQGLCPVIQQRCSGPNAQFSSLEDCASQLGQKPFGNFDEAWGDNLACRTIHIILTQVRPEVHCPHVGPSGGGRCVDINYSEDYFADESLFDAPLGSVFTCGAALQPDDQVGAGPGATAILQGLSQAAAAGQIPSVAGAGTGASEQASPDMSGAGALPPSAADARVAHTLAQIGPLGRIASNGEPSAMSPAGAPMAGAEPGIAAASRLNALSESMPPAPGRYGTASGLPNAISPAAGAPPQGEPSSFQASNVMVPGSMQDGSCVCPSYQPNVGSMQAAVIPGRGGLPSTNNAPPAREQKHSQSPPHVGGPVNSAHAPAPQIPGPVAQMEEQGAHHFKRLG